MKARLLLLGLGLGAAACGTEVTIDAGVDAGVFDTGPTMAPSPPVLGTVIDRAGRPFVPALLVGGSTTARDADRVRYNGLTPTAYEDVTAPVVLTDGSGNPTAAALLLEDLGLYDALDGQCLQGTLTSSAGPNGPHNDLANLLADDRIWLDVSAERTSCTDLFAVERRALGFGAMVPSSECGGRAPGVDALDQMLQLIAGDGVADGVTSDGAPIGDTEPFFELP